jgi:hypothetical protein
MRLTIALVAVMTVAGVAAPASADEGIPVEWIQATCGVDPGDEWASRGAAHVRNEVHHDVIWKDVGEGQLAPVGTNEIRINYDISLKTFNGRGGGTFLAQLPDFAFAGHFNGSIRSGLLTARAIGDGSGAMAGAKLEALIVQFQPTEDQLSWLCDGGTVYKAVSVSAVIKP